MCSHGALVFRRSAPHRVVEPAPSVMATVPPGGKEWLEAAKRGDVGAMEPLLAANPDLLSYNGKGCSLGFIGHTALHWAAAKGQARHPRSPKADPRSPFSLHQLPRTQPSCPPRGRTG